MPILTFCISILFFLVINLFLALFLSSIVVVLLKMKRVQVDTLEMNFLVFLCCASLTIGVRVIQLNFYTFENFTTVFLWPLHSLMPRDIIEFLNSSASL